MSDFIADNQLGLVILAFLAALYFFAWALFVENVPPFFRVMLVALGTWLVLWAAEFVQGVL